MSQTLLNALISLAALLPVAVDVFLVYRLFQFFPFTSAAIFGLAPYLTLGFFSRGLPATLAVLAALAASLAFAALVGTLLTWLLRVRRSSPLQLFLLSMGLLVVVQSLVALAFGSQPTPLPLFEARSIALPVGTVGPARMAMIAWALVILGFLGLILWKTRLGLEWRALANDRGLSEILGLRPRRALLAAFCFGALLTAGAGILQAADTAMSPAMGLRVFMIAAVAVVVGGQRLQAVIAAAAAVALAQSFGALAFGGSWQDAVVFAVLLLFLLARPRGLAAPSGRPERLA